MTVPKHWKGVGLVWQDMCECCCHKYKLSVGWWWNWLKGNSRVCLNPDCQKTVVSARSATFVPHSYAGGDISSIVSSRPVGSYYMIYNEPDDPGQADHAPDFAADRYFDAYRAIKDPETGDPTAQVGGIGLAWIAGDGHCDEGPSPPRPDGEDYLDKFLDRLAWKNDNTAGLDARLDFYHVHAYYHMWQPNDPGEWVVAGGAANTAGTGITFERLKKHLDWVHGDLRTGHETELPASVPVWITETSHLTGNADANESFMGTLWTWLNTAGEGFDQSIVRVAWFSTRSSFEGTDLFEADLSTLTGLGEDWLAKEDNEMFTRHPDCNTFAHSSWDGDSKSGSATYSIPVTEFSQGGIYVPSGVKAVYVRICVKWSSQDDSYEVGVAPGGGGAHLSARNRKANVWHDGNGIVPVPTSGEHAGRIDVKLYGTNDLSGIHVFIVGYWE